MYTAWLALVLKTSFALVGIGAYATIFFEETSPLAVKLIAATFAVLFGFLNARGAHKTGSYQAILVFGLLSVLAAFMVMGTPAVNTGNVTGFFDAGTESILATTGMVYVSYVGVPKVARVSEEVRDPERNLPLAILAGVAATGAHWSDDVEVARRHRLASGLAVPRPIEGAGSSDPSLT